jgi:hypothetical protein
VAAVRPILFTSHNVETTRLASVLAQQVLDDYYEAARARDADAAAGVAPYRPLKPDALYFGRRNGPIASPA